MPGVVYVDLNPDALEIDYFATGTDNPLQPLTAIASLWEDGRQATQRRDADKRGGKESGRARQENAEEWRVLAKQSYDDLKKRNPRRSAYDIAKNIFLKIPARPARSTLYKYLLTLGKTSTCITRKTQSR